MERLPRKLKKKVRVCCLCITLNPNTKKEKIDKARWIRLKNDFGVWLNILTISDRRSANSIHLKHFSFSIRNKIKRQKYYKSLLFHEMKNGNLLNVIKNLNK